MFQLKVQNSQLATVNKGSQVVQNPNSLRCQGARAFKGQGCSLICCVFKTCTPPPACQGAREMDHGPCVEVVY